LLDFCLSGCCTVSKIKKMGISAKWMKSLVGVKKSDKAGQHKKDGDVSHLKDDVQFLLNASFSL
jgi:hypothetical protein